MLIPKFKSVLKAETLIVTVNMYHLVRKITFQEQTHLLYWRASEKCVKCHGDPGKGLGVCKMLSHQMTLIHCTY